MVSSKGKGVIFSPTLLILIRKQTIELLEAARHKLVLQSVLQLFCSRTTTIATLLSVRVLHGSLKLMV